MFNDKYGLTQAVLEGCKTQTRRLASSMFKQWEVSEAVGDFLGTRPMSFEEYAKRNSPYKVGEEVAIAQSYRTIIQESIDRHQEYKGSCSMFTSKGLNNKMFVKANLMPHRIKITNIRAEYLQDISYEDCLKEGIKLKKGRFLVENYKGVEFYTDSPRLAFAYLINKICGKETWDFNPYVLVYDFELIK